ncbi:substrate-binding periplasmic protein [Pseudomonas zhanjiangensis]|uniref:Substrate-binding periplasmic protein n=1 Tax=Pseudomonas zhanjiangensis TaxID=3239015 RepID=A0ABV3YNU1_9PSED
MSFHWHDRLRYVCLTLALLCVSIGARAEVLVIAGDPWCPVNCEPGSDQPGIFVELARDIFAEAGIEVQYRLVNWARALHAVRKGQLNAVIGAGHEDAPDFLFPSTPVSHSRMCFYAQPSSQWRFDGLVALAGQRLGVINDYSYGAELDAYIQRHADDPTRVLLAYGDRALGLNVDKLLGGRIDVTLANTWVMQNWLRRRGRSGQLRNVGCRTPDVPIYLAFSPALASSQRYLALFEAGLRRYREDGRLLRLLERYGVNEP